MARVSLGDAASNTQRDVLDAHFQTDDVVSRFDAFLKGIAAAVNPGEESGRLIANWVTIARARRNLLKTSGLSSGRFFEVYLISDIQSLMLLNFKVAEDQGVSSGIVNSDLLDAYNAAWEVSI